MKSGGFCAVVCPFFHLWFNLFLRSLRTSIKFINFSYNAFPLVPFPYHSFPLSFPIIHLLSYSNCLFFFTANALNQYILIFSPQRLVFSQMVPSRLQRTSFHPLPPRSYSDLIPIHRRFIHKLWMLDWKTPHIFILRISKQFPHIFSPSLVSVLKYQPASYFHVF